MIFLVFCIPGVDFSKIRSIIAPGTQLFIALSCEEVEPQKHFLALNFFTRKSSKKSWVPGAIFKKLTPVQNFL